MKKILMATAIAVMAMLGVAAGASASYDSTRVTVGRSITANGIISIQGSIVTTECTDVVFGGRVTSVGSPSTASVASGTADDCGIADVIFDGFPWTKTQILGVTSGSGTWSLGTIEARVTAIGGAVDCYYRGGISGTWESDGVDTILTIDADSLSLLRDDGSPLFPCTTTPVVGGTLILLGVPSV